MVRGHRELLRAAALRVLHDQGVARTTARDLVAASGTNLNSIRYHFGTKDALVADALATLFAAWTGRPVAAAETAEGGPAASMLAAVRTMLDGLPARRADFVVVLDAIAEAERNEQLAASLRALHADSLRAITGSIRTAEPRLPEEAARILARIVMALNDGLSMQAALGDSEDLADVDGLMVGMVGLGVTLAEALGLPPSREELTQLGVALASQGGAS